ncbi:MAG TPA: malto-oligosyltrehalose synthase, partial [Flavisolibacter sp.]|nr:malto-oligosyltrehalose synthase [Flavisolibacter sp.]
MFNPITTYRFQFHKEFTFRSFQQIIPYLKKLGIHTVYASPIFKSVPGSTHGYDGLDPHMINPEIGTLDEFLEIRKQLDETNIAWLQDIVPNHMSYHHENLWLMDIMEKGPQSVYASYFDTAWSSQLFKGPPMVPFLGGDLMEEIEKGNIHFLYKHKRLSLAYFDNVYPLNSASYKRILLSEDKKAEELIKLISAIPEPGDNNTYRNEWEKWLEELGDLMQKENIKEFLTQSLDRINNDKEVLSSIINDQYYRLCSWKESDKHINYRRFFIVNSLICLNIQDATVFDDYHLLIKKLTEEGKFQGLRIDHIDGLYNPDQYLERLRNMCGDETYIVVEKILEAGEEFPKKWPIEGNTGYDFLALINNLFTNRSSKRLFTDYYQQLFPDKRPVEELIAEKKSYILYNHMKGELENLFQLFIALAIADPASIKKTGEENIKKAIGEFLIHVPVYRFYINKLPLDQNQYNSIKNILNKILNKNNSLSGAVHLLEEVLLKRPVENNDKNNAALMFLQRCMQFTGPLMAKGVEDTLMYTYNRFLGHNEVGDAPEAFGITQDEFHGIMQERQLQWPLSLNASSTHDTKRGEDVRARLNILTDMGNEWIKKVEEWRVLNIAHKPGGSPDVNDEYFIYQTMVGAYTMPGEDEDDFSNRLEAYLQKALRESKRNSDWGSPNVEYEKATANFIKRLLDKQQPFFKNFSDFHYKIAEHGIINSLSQLVLKFTLPGVPDTYQGCELWDLSLVDPDNRRPVDYVKRAQWLDAMNGKEPVDLIKELWAEKFNGKIKLWLTNNLLKLRLREPNIFIDGTYIPLKAEGFYKENIFAFARKLQNKVYIIIVPLHTAIMCDEQGKQTEELDWKDTVVSLPADTKPEWENIIVNRSYSCTKNISIMEMLAEFPIAILKGQYEANERSAGILMHISSLPSPYGTGDLGKEAKSFANFLYRSHQKYWQMLPVNPTGKGQGYSPYSAFSSTAGNTILISPELLEKKGLLSASDLQKFKLPLTGKADFNSAEQIRNELFEIAWHRYKNGDFFELKTAFDEFK